MHAILVAIGICFSATSIKFHETAPPAMCCGSLKQFVLLAIVFGFTVSKMHAGGLTAPVTGGCMNDDHQPQMGYLEQPTFASLAQKRKTIGLKHL